MAISLFFTRLSPFFPLFFIRFDFLKGIATFAAD